jgi:hypothetical protein
MKQIQSYTIIILFLISSCNSGYDKQDGSWVWISYDEGAGKRINEIDPHHFETFEVLDNEEYARDKNSVFYVGQIIKNADPKSFEVIGNGYSKDLNNVFLDAKTIVFANPTTFKQLEFPYSKDDAYVFCGTIPLELDKNEIDEFVVTNENELMSTSKSTILLSHFIEHNPKYQWLDTLNIDGVIVGEWATSNTNERKFKGYKEVK